MSRIVGIDFGTTNSVIAVLEGGEPVVIPNSRGERLTPSVVAFSDSGDLLVGATAKNQAIINYERTVSSVKRKFGEDFSIDIDGREITAEQVASFVIERLKKSAEEFTGGPVDRAIITVPAYFNDGQRNSVKKAGELAGLEVLRLINEPTAAALAFDRSGGTDGTLLVFDLGGGTFDVSILDLSGSVYEVVATRGNNRLGGDDFDALLVQHVCTSFYREHNIDLRQDRMALQKVRDACELAKKELSDSESTTIAVPFISADQYGPKHLELAVSRMDFENLIAEHLDTLSDLVDGAIEDAGLSPADVDSVLLAGGSTRIPAVRDILEVKFPGRVMKNANPDECVAAGAAVQAGIIDGGVKDLVLVDVTPLTLGIKADNDVFVPIIERNSCIPTRASRIFTTVTDGQVEVEVEIYQGERLQASKNYNLGKFTLGNIEPQRRGEPRIEVMFDIDVNGIVHVSAVDKHSGAEKKIEIVPREDISDEEVEKIVQDAEQHREEDEVAVGRLRLVEKARALLDIIRSRRPEDESSDRGAEEIVELAEYIEKVLESDDIDEIRSAIETMNVYLSEMAVA